jgi:hypothetical protein
VKKLLIIAGLLALNLFVFAQEVQDKKSTKQLRKEEKNKKIDDLVRQQEEGILIYNKQSVFAFQLKTNGYGFFYEKAKRKSQRNAMVYHIGFSEIKHPKEDKLPNGTGGFSFGNPYVYGKINNFYQLDLGFGQQRIIGQKGNKNGVAVALVYKGGLSLGLLRPYYIQVDDNGIARTIKYTPQDSALFVGGPIIGGGGLGKGWGEIKIKPGIFVNTAIRFDFGRFNEVVSGVEVGVGASFYSSEIPIMLFQDDQQFFYQGHIAIMFGHRK